MKAAHRILAGTMSLLMTVSISGTGVTAFAGSTTEAETTTAAETTAAGTTAAETTAASGTTAAAASTDGSGEKVFRFAVTTEPTTLDQTKGSSVVDNEIQRALSEGLVRFTNGEVQPGCAESWDVSDDQKTYTFHLRDGLKWSDGKDLTAQDFVYSFQRLVDPDTASLLGWVAGTAGILNANECNSGDKDVSELGIAAPDDKTVVVTLSHPTHYFLSLIGSTTNFNPVRKDIVDQYGQDFASTADKNVYCGPYVLDSTENQRYIFKKNPNYWNADAVHFDRVEESVITEANTQLAMYESGDLDYVDIPLEEVANYTDSKEHGSYMDGSDDFGVINCTSETQPLLQDVNFRKALNYALDRKTYISLAVNDVYTPATTFVLPQVPGANGGTYGEEFSDKLHAYPLEGDMDQAKECLQKAMDTAGISDPSQITLEFTCVDSAAEKKVVEVLQQMWKENLGINIDVKQVTFAEKYTNAFPNHDYEISYAGDSDAYDAYTYLELFRSDNPNNFCAYSNEEYDKKLDSTVTMTDNVERLTTLTECENMLLDDAVVIPLQFRMRHYLLKPNFSGIVFSAGAVNLDWSFGDCSTG